ISRVSPQSSIFPSNNSQKRVHWKLITIGMAAIFYSSSLCSGIEPCYYYTGVIRGRSKKITIKPSRSSSKGMDLIDRR
ncbi:388_t:CDS:1, partial [Funneliformis mosseae]